eukprot:9472699-Pyramimonas_sp.AAC.2
MAISVSALAVVLFTLGAKPLDQIHPSAAAALARVPPQWHSLARGHHVVSGYGLFRRTTSLDDIDDGGGRERGGGAAGGCD